ncbi:Fe-S metabolism associated domain, SufE-like [Dillenia turbinata]|uniref:Fe-S metabolism associated domain, SufE-like n=1 Tax=Dillenia turbinata TaxID=194707 RepID=A0AAN8V292_9MAGN
MLTLCTARPPPPPPSSPLCFARSLKRYSSTQLKLTKRKYPNSKRRLFVNPTITISSLSCSPPRTEEAQAAERLEQLVSEFRSLPEPIDRVKRLLHYATLLNPFDDSARIPANSVSGCTAQVWLEVKIDEFEKVRFLADSDSEITKGFCSCLIWLLDGASPEEVLNVRTEDLRDLNVGLNGRAQSRSRVNPWHNVLVSMQKKTKDLILDKQAFQFQSFLCM